MATAIFDITHAETLDELPPDRWRKFWRHILSRQAVALYEFLRGAHGERVDLAYQVRMSAGAVNRALEELEAHGFVDLVDWETD